MLEYVNLISVTDLDLKVMLFCFALMLESSTLCKNYSIASYI